MRTGRVSFTIRRLRRCRDWGDELGHVQAPPGGEKKKKKEKLSIAFWLGVQIKPSIGPAKWCQSWG
jgi:hypothetical protein